MNLSKNQQQWVMSLAKRALGERVVAEPGIVAKQTQQFLEELCELMENTARSLNECLGGSQSSVASHLVCHAFRLGQPRPGIMILRGKEKLVVSAEIGRIKARVVNVQAYNEVCLNTLEVVAKISQHQGVEWWTSDNGSTPSVLVSPDLVLRYYLGHFFAEGCKYFYPPNSSLAQNIGA